jgi:hypothetical protein
MAISKKAKAIYDRKYRKRNRASLKAKKAAYFQRTYDPAKAKKERKKRMPQHVEYCRQPKYKAWKREYDRLQRARKFGGFAEAYEVLKELQKEIRRQMPDRFERYAQSGRKQWNPINQRRYRRKTNEQLVANSY